jgi:serine/threonine protein kinase
MFLLINVSPFYYRPLLSSSWLPLFFICFIFFCILSFFWQMLEAVDTIHEERIVHTDLKPANFLFVNGILKLIDFGIAKAISDDTTNIHRENQVGTLRFRSGHRITRCLAKKSKPCTGYGNAR